MVIEYETKVISKEIRSIVFWSKEGFYPKIYAELECLIQKNGIYFLDDDEEIQNYIDEFDIEVEEFELIKINSKI